MVNLKIDSRELLNIPNSISLFRILIIYPFIHNFLKENYITTVILILLSALSDLFDGTIARKLNQQTRLGAILDPIADKLTLAAVVVCVGIKFPIVFPIVILLILKELLMLSGGLFLIKKGITPAVSQWYGKVATIVFYCSMSIIVGLDAIFKIQNDILTFSLMAVTSISMFYALFRYFIMFLGLLKENKSKSKT